jgi:hypothetical protein
MDTGGGNAPNFLGSNLFITKVSESHVRGSSTAVSVKLELGASLLAAFRDAIIFGCGLWVMAAPRTAHISDRVATADFSAVPLLTF